MYIYTRGHSNDIVTLRLRSLGVSYLMPFELILASGNFCESKVEFGFLDLQYLGI